ncbi:cell wall metabolism sensor histidine kinase WalK [Sulfitobacter sp. S190]|uniref:sensor histidine kinase n=1 Tax=Sulfitobacter sp. S190 TaxID=2867022 RepID=UPI0021A71F33|nr:HAMP domain-containing sensor histidine kinase [Sulfitobacter sp. S190]UWR21935.1 HAMP domain-containing histidine kinase [Sulfitobacter sp. S190]
MRGRPLYHHPIGAALAGGALATAWYATCQSVVPQPIADWASMFGAIAVAASVPLWLSRKPQKRMTTTADPVEALKALRDEVWIIDATTRKIRFANDTALARQGRQDRHEADEAFSDWLHLDDDGLLNDAIRQISEGHADTEQCRITRGVQHFEVDLTRLRKADQPDRILIVFHDVTLSAAHEQLKADFVSTVSHELRSPLTSIKGAMGLLLSNAAGDLPKPARGLLEIAHRNAERLVLIINDILDLEKIVAGGMEFDVSPVDLSALAKEAVASSALYFERFDLQIDIVGADQPHWVNTDPNRIMQVLTNLLTNAAKFSRTGGTLELRLDTSATGTTVSVKDHGAGIPEADQHKIFQRFADMTNSDRAAKGGTGLGLSICKAIVENLGGQIGFDSVEGEGATFYFILPDTEAAQNTAPNTVSMQSVG